MSATETCSQASLDAEEPLAGTATEARRWLLVEVRGAWGRDPVADTELPPGVRERLSELEGRVTFVRRPDRREGALPKMLPPFWIGAGGSVGSGLQYWPWIHLEDWVALVRRALEDTTVSGPLNLTSPNPVRNRDFARTLGQVIHRPAFLPTPGFALKMLLGEMADGLLLSGQRAIPAKAEQLGFQFRYRDLEPALRALFSQ